MVDAERTVNSAGPLGAGALGEVSHWRAASPFSILRPSSAGADGGGIGKGPPLIVPGRI